MIFLLGGAFYGYNQIFSGDEDLLVSRNDENNCPVDGPSAYTAIVIDQSEGFPKNQVQEMPSQILEAYLISLKLQFLDH